MSPPSPAQLQDPLNTTGKRCECIESAVRFKNKENHCMSELSGPQGC